MLFKTNELGSVQICSRLKAEIQIVGTSNYE